MKKPESYVFKIPNHANSVIILTENVKVQCTKCKKTKPIREVGLRNIGAGKIYNQPQCKKCRANT